MGLEIADATYTKDKTFISLESKGFYKINDVEVTKEEYNKQLNELLRNAKPVDIFNHE